MLTLLGYQKERVTREIRDCKIKLFNTDREVQEVALQIGPINLDCIPWAPNRNALNAIAGFKHRILKPFKDRYWALRDNFGFYLTTWKQKDRLIEQLQNRDPLHPIIQLKMFVEDHILPNIPIMPFIEPSRQFFNQWLEKLEKAPSRKNVLAVGFEELMHQNFTLQYKDLRAKVFIKKEFYEDEKFARIICPRDEKVFALLGPYIRQFEDFLFQDSIYKDHFLKHLNHDQIAAKMSETFPVFGPFLETDYSSFEGSFSPAYLHVVEVAIWRKYFVANPIILKAMESCYSTSHFVSKYFSARTHGSRFSGDLWTSCMNGFSNLINMMYLCHQKKTKFVGLVEGDDGLFWVSNKNITPQDYDSIGFTIKMDYKSAINQCTFCQKIFDPETLNLLAPPELLNRVGWTMDMQYQTSKRRKQKELLCAKAYSYLVMYPNSPLVSIPLRKILSAYSEGTSYRNVVLSTDWHHQYLLNEPFPEEKAIDIRDRILYEQLFGISMAEQIDFEEQFDPYNNFNLPLGVSNVNSCEFRDIPVVPRDRHVKTCQ